MAQVRHDIKIYLSLIGSQQAAPMSGTESAIDPSSGFSTTTWALCCLSLVLKYFEHACPGWDEVGVVHAFSGRFACPVPFQRTAQHNWRVDIRRRDTYQDDSKTTTKCRLEFMWGGIICPPIGFTRSHCSINFLHENLCRPGRVHERNNWVCGDGIRLRKRTYTDSR